MDGAEMTEPSIADSPFGTSIQHAKVTEVFSGSDGNRIAVASPSFGRCAARLATLGDYAPRVGDGVLVASTPDGSRFVIGVLSALRPVSPKAPLVARDGASASLEADPEDGQDVLVVRDARGALLFEHRPGRSIVSVPHDLELRAEGDLALSAGGRIRMQAAETFTARSDGPVELRSGLGDEHSALELDGARTALHTNEVAVRAESANVQMKDANLVLGTLRTTVGRIREKAEVVERTAGRIVERARESYREVEGLSQTRAGRVRWVAEQAFSVLGERVTVKAREDVKVKGEKIYLG